MSRVFTPSRRGLPYSQQDDIPHTATFYQGNKSSNPSRHCTSFLSTVRLSLLVASSLVSSLFSLPAGTQENPSPPSPPAISHMQEETKENEITRNVREFLNGGKIFYARGTSSQYLPTYLRAPAGYLAVPRAVVGLRVVQDGKEQWIPGELFSVELPKDRPVTKMTFRREDLRDKIEKVLSAVTPSEKERLVFAAYVFSFDMELKTNLKESRPLVVGTPFHLPYNREKNNFEPILSTPLYTEPYINLALAVGINFDYKKYGFKVPIPFFFGLRDYLVVFEPIKNGIRGVIIGPLSSRKDVLVYNFKVEFPKPVDIYKSNNLHILASPDVFVVTDGERGAVIALPHLKTESFTLPESCTPAYCMRYGYKNGPFTTFYFVPKDSSGTSSRVVYSVEITPDRISSTTISPRDPLFETIVNAEKHATTPSR